MKIMYWVLVITNLELYKNNILSMYETIFLNECINYEKIYMYLRCIF